MRVILGRQFKRLGECRGSGRAAARVPDQHHARPGADRDREGLLRQGTRQERQARASSRSAPAPRKPPRCSPASSTPPTSARTRRSRRGRPRTASLIKVISGAASGGAALVVKKGITSPAQLKGQKLATPSLGNTQDVALRYWLEPAPPDHHPDRRRRRADHADHAELGRGAPVQVRARSPAAGSQRPTTSRWCRTAGTCWSNEASLWPQGQFVTTNLVVTSEVPRRAPVDGDRAAQGPDRGRTTTSTATRQAPRRRPTPN